MDSNITLSELLTQEGVTKIEIPKGHGFSLKSPGISRSGNARKHTIVIIEHAEDEE